MLTECEADFFDLFHQYPVMRGTLTFHLTTANTKKGMRKTRIPPILIRINGYLLNSQSLLGSLILRI